MQERGGVESPAVAMGEADCALACVAGATGLLPWGLEACERTAGCA